MYDGTPYLTMNSFGSIPAAGANGYNFIQWLYAGSSLSMKYNGTDYITLNSTGLMLAAGTKLMAPVISGGSLVIVSSQITVNINAIDYVKVSDSSSQTNSQMRGNMVSVQDNLAPNGPNVTMAPFSGFRCSNSLVGIQAYLSPTGLACRGLMSTSPGGGGEFWYDPSDGNRVKFAP